MADNGSEGTGCLALLAVIAAIAAVTWWFLSPSPGPWWGDTRTAFVAVCSVPYKGNDCAKVESPGLMVSYRVNRNTGEVAWLIHSDEEIKVGVSKNCAIFDADNWTCRDDEMLTMRDGDFALASPTSYNIMRPVPRWRYKYLQFKEFTDKP
jgi:hypothetical protein